MSHLLAIDQGTTNTRTYLFTANGQITSSHRLSLNQHHPQNGWVEQDPEKIWNQVLTCTRETLRKANLKAQAITSLGITNQRETTLLWHRETGSAVYPAINWQDRRTDNLCQKFRQSPIAHQIQSKTGLVLDPYFSATKLVWLLDTIPGLRKLAEAGKLAFGTIDTFLLWRLTKGKIHATDATNASRTLLFNIHSQTWDPDLLRAFDIPASLLPRVLDSADDFGHTDPEHFGAPIPIGSLIGDQQAATVGQACFKPGMIKSTYGTGCFMLLNTGDVAVSSQHRLLTTLAYRLKAKPTYGLEGSIFSAGNILKWLRDNLNCLAHIEDSQALAEAVPDTDGVYLLPAFNGLGAPYWNPTVRASLVGLSGATTREHIVRAGLEAVAYQTQDLIQCMREDYPQTITTLRVDGGMTANTWLLQFLADILQLKVATPTCIETTALGAAFLAGLQAGVYRSLDEIAEVWQTANEYTQQMDSAQRLKLYQGWQKALAALLRD